MTETAKLWVNKRRYRDFKVFVEKYLYILYNIPMDFV